MASQHGQTNRRPGGGGAGSQRGPSPNGRGEDYYNLLGVPYNATQADIRAAYRRAMKRNHPDRQVGRGREDAEELAKSLNQAYATLSKPDKRRAYDQTIRREVINEQIMNRYVGGFNPPDMSQDILDPHAQRMRRNLTADELRDRRSAHRSTLVSLGVAFGGIFVAFMVILLVFALVSSIVANVF